MFCSHQLLPCDLLHKVATNHSHCTVSLTLFTILILLTVQCHSHCTQYYYFLLTLYSVTHTTQYYYYSPYTVQYHSHCTEYYYYSLYTVLLTVQYHSLTLYTVLLLLTVQYHSVTVHSTTHWVVLLTLPSITHCTVSLTT